MKKIAFCALVGAMCAANPVSATDLGGPALPADMFAAPVSGKPISWTGVYIGGQVGYGNTNHDVGVSELESEVAVGLDGINSHGFFGGGTVGADFQAGRVVFGVFGDYNFSAIDTKAGVSVGGIEYASASIEEGDSWLVAGRLGYLVSERALVYGLAGYGQTDMVYRVNLGGAEESLDKTFSGWVLGAGGEYALTKNIFLGLEYQHFFGGKETLYDADGFKLTDEVDADKVMAKLKIKLNQR